MKRDLTRQKHVLGDVKAELMLSFSEISRRRPHGSNYSNTSIVEPFLAESRRCEAASDTRLKSLGDADRLTPRFVWPLAGLAALQSRQAFFLARCVNRHLELLLFPPQTTGDT